jgi:hypothetical protein
MKLFSLIQILYSVLVFCYTLYGYSKNISESLCSEKRPGSLLKSQGVQFNVSYFEAASIFTGSADYQLCDLKCYDDTTGCKNFEGSSQRDSMIDFFYHSSMSGGYESYNYEFNDTGFKVSYYKSESFDVLSCDGFVLKTLAPNEISGVSVSLDAVLWMNYYYDSRNFTGSYHSYGVCHESSFAQDCTFSKRSQDAFLFFSIVFATIFIFLLILSLPFVKLRFIVCSTMRVFFGDKVFDILKFCNPLNCKYSVKRPGDKYISIKVCQNQVFDDFGLCNTFIKFENYSFHLVDDSFTIFKNTGLLSVFFECKLKPEKLNQVRHILMAISISPDNWPLSEKMNHFLSIESFVEFLLNDELNLCSGIFDKKTVVTELCFEDYLKEYCGLNLDTIKVLVTHNKEFFGHLNIPCLVKACQRKMGWIDRPRSAGNSQWKRYTNDVSKYLVSRGVKCNFHQFRNNEKAFTNAMCRSVKTFVSNDYVDLEMKDIAKDLDNVVVKTDPSNLISLEIDEIFNKITSLGPEEGVPFTNEQLSLLNKSKDRNEAIKKLEEIGDKNKIAEQRAKLHEMNKEKERVKTSITNMEKNMKKSKYKPKPNDPEKLSELSYKHKLLNEECDSFDKEITKMSQEEGKKELFISLKMGDDYLFLQKEENKMIVKAQLLDKLLGKSNTNVPGQAESKEISETAKKIGFYSTIMKRGKSWHKGSKKSNIKKIDVKCKEYSEYRIELNNRYACLYPDEVDPVSDKLSDETSRHQNVGRSKKISIIPELGFGTKGGEALKKCVYSVKYDGHEMSDYCKFKHCLKINIINARQILESKPPNPQITIREVKKYSGGVLNRFGRIKEASEGRMKQIQSSALSVAEVRQHVMNIVNKEKELKREIERKKYIEARMKHLNPRG